MNPKEFSQEQLDEIAHRLNSRPRKTFKFMTPSRKFSELLQRPPEPAPDSRTLR